MVDYTKRLRVIPTRVIPKSVSRNAFTYEFEDGQTRSKNLSSNKYDAQMQWDFISAAERETILDWYHDSTKANGVGRTFFWEDPRSGTFYETRFMGPLRTVFVPGFLQSVDAMNMRLATYPGQPFSNYTEMELYVESGTYMEFI